MRAARAREHRGRTRSEPKGRTSNYPPIITTAKPTKPATETGEPTGKASRFPTLTPSGFLARAACAGHPNAEWWFAAPSESRNAEKARRICDGCPVKLQCRQWALDNNEREGIWGGLNVEERDNYGMAGTPYAPPKPDGRRLHGHRAKYQQGCKCAPCKSANAAYIRETAHEQANRGGG